MTKYITIIALGIHRTGKLIVRFNAMRLFENLYLWRHIFISIGIFPELSNIMNYSVQNFTGVSAFTEAILS